MSDPGPGERFCGQQTLSLLDLSRECSSKAMPQASTSTKHEFSFDGERRVRRGVSRHRTGDTPSARRIASREHAWHTTLRSASLPRSVRGPELRLHPDLRSCKLEAYVLQRLSPADQPIRRGPRQRCERNHQIPAVTNPSSVRTYGMLVAKHPLFIADGVPRLRPAPPIEKSLRRARSLTTRATDASLHHLCR